VQYFGIGEEREKKNFEHVPDHGRMIISVPETAVRIAGGCASHPTQVSHLEIHLTLSAHGFHHFKM